MSLEPDVRERIAELVASNEVLLFMKGNRSQPQCGFSATVIGILDALVPDYQTFDVLSDGAIREGIKEFSEWPTIPQLYVKGTFIGGCDIIQELYAEGELHSTLGISLEDVAEPAITVTDAAAAGLHAATAGARPDQTLHLGIDARLQAALSLAPVAPGEITIESNGVTLHLDRLTASRADGVTIDAIETPQGTGFRIENPRTASRVQQLSVADLKRMLDARESFEFLDVRTPEERATASLPGTRIVDEAEAKRLEALPRDTMLVFHCHHGGRSQAAAEHFAGLGFTNVWNVAGGIDAWSREIDPAVPRY